MLFDRNQKGITLASSIIRENTNLLWKIQGLQKNMQQLKESYENSLNQKDQEHNQLLYLVTIHEATR